MIRFESRFMEYMEKVSGTLRTNKDWRPGQACFNVLCEVDNKLAEEIRGTEIDPFHNEKNLEGFFNKVQESWKEEKESRIKKGSILDLLG